MPPRSKLSPYVRGSASHYSALAKKSAQSRIRRNVSVQIMRDPKVVTTVPERKRETDAGFDISSCENVAIAPGRTVSIRTGLRLLTPKGYFFRIEGRSSLNMNLRVMADVIDAGYTGEVFVRVVNTSDSLFKVGVGDRIAQIVFYPQIHAQFQAVDEFKVSAGDRGEAGFGSSGK